MRIKQAFVGSPFFKDAFLKKYGLEEYRLKDEPAIFFGCYHTNWRWVMAHQSIVVIIWAGTDATRILSGDRFHKFLCKNRHRIFHVAISKYIEKDLAMAGLAYKSFPVLPHTVSGIEPLPHGNSIYAYIPHIRPEFYGSQLVKQVKYHFPDIPVIRCSTRDYSRDDLIKYVYPKCFIGLRLTPHDGLSNTVIELALCGRRSVCNAGYPTTLPWKNIESVIRLIRREKTNPPNPKEISDTVKKWLNVENDWLNVEFWESTLTKKQKSIKVMGIETYQKKRTPRFIKLAEDECDKHGIFSGPPTVSVIINTYNEDPDKLRQAVQSYENQQGVNVQIIISTVRGDPSVSYGKKHTVICSEDPGIYEQLNAACNLIGGEWFCYASGNDVAEPTKCIKEINQCLKTGKLVCYSAYTIVDENLENPILRGFQQYSYQDHLVGNFVSDCAMINTNLLKKFLPFRNEQYGNHAYWDLWLRIYENLGDVFCYLPEATWKYRQESKSAHIQRKKNVAKMRINADLRAKLIKDHVEISKNLRLRLRSKQ